MHTLQNAHYFPLTSQGNIYTLSLLRLVNGTNKLLVASLRREVICFEYLENASGILVPTSKEISFTYLPNGAEIISLTAFNKSETCNDFVIGITIIKNSNDLHALETYLNIYSEWEGSAEFNMESISQNCLNNLELKFIPYHLTHTFLISCNEEKINKEVVFLLSGSDNKVHVYQENKTNHIYKEIDCKEYFLEFLKPPSIVVWMDVYYYNNYQERVTVFGCECGYVRLCKVCVKTNRIIFNFSTRFDNTISVVRLYSNTHELKHPPFIKQEYYEPPIIPEKNPVLNLVVTNTVLPAVFFADVLQYGLKKYGTLPRHELTSVLSCAEIADIDFDGCDEILIGSSDKDIVAYKFDTNQGWCIAEIKKFSTPVLGIKYVDITGDGIKELVVLTMKGVHILQHAPTSVQEALEEKVKILTIPNIDKISLEK